MWLLQSHSDVSLEKCLFSWSWFEELDVNSSLSSMNSLSDIFQFYEEDMLLGFFSTQRPTDSVLHIIYILLHIFSRDVLRDW